MKIISKLSILIIVFCSLALLPAFSQTILNVAVDDQSSGGTAPFTYHIEVSIVSGQNSGTGVYNGADSDPMPVETNFNPDWLPGTWTCHIEKYDVNVVLVGNGGDTGTITWDGQIVVIKVVDP